MNATGLAIGTYTGKVMVTNRHRQFAIVDSVTLQVLSQDMTETFGDLGTGWIISPMGNAGGWSAPNGVYSYNGAGLSQSCAGNTAWSDYTLDANIKLSTLSNWPGGVRARVNPSTGAGYVVWLYPGSNQVILYKVAAWSVNDPSLTLFGQAAATFDSSAFHDLGVAFHGSQISVYWNGKLLISATDSTYSTGFVCLDAGSQPISYSNIRVAAVQNPDYARSTFASKFGVQCAPGKHTCTPNSQCYGGWCLNHMGSIAFRCRTLAHDLGLQHNYPGCSDRFGESDGFGGRNLQCNNLAVGSGRDEFSDLYSL